MGRRIGSIFAVVALILSIGGAAFADGARDLGDGIAFYENLDLERARPRLVAASQAPELEPTARGRAFMYLGLLEFELGNRAKAEAAWTSAFQIHHEASVPKGTSPKTITALEAVRSRTEALPQPPAVKPGDVPQDPEPVVEPPAPALEPRLDPPTPALVAPAPTEDDEGSSMGLWIGVGAGVAAVAGAVVLGVLLAGADEGGCPRGGGAGCLTVDLR